MEYYAIGDTQFYISHHGVMGMHWGVRRFQPYGQGGYSPKKERLERKIDKAKGKIEKNNAKLDKLNNYSNTSRNQRREIKRLKLEKKRSKLTKKVEGARTRKMLYDLDPTRRESKAMRKAYKLDKKIARIVKKQDSWKLKVSKLEYRNLKLERKVDKYIYKLDNLEQSAFTSIAGGVYLAHYGKKGMRWGKHTMASTQYWLTDQQAANMRAANKNLTDQQSRNINAARPVNQPKPAGNTTLSDQQAKNVAATKNSLTDQQQKNVNEAKTETSSSKSTSYDKEKIDKVVDSVINGNYGNGEERKKALAKEGYDYAEVQNLVNEKLGSSKRHEATSTKSESAQKGSSTLSDQQAKNSSSSGKAKKDSTRDVETYGKEFIHQKAKRRSSRSGTKTKKSKRKSTRRQGKNIVTDQQRVTLYPNARRRYVVK